MFSVFQLDCFFILFYNYKKKTQFNDFLFVLIANSFRCCFFCIVVVLYLSFPTQHSSSDYYLYQRLVVMQEEAVLHTTIQSCCPHVIRFEENLLRSQ